MKILESYYEMEYMINKKVRIFLKSTTEYSYSKTTYYALHRNIIRWISNGI